MDHFTQVLIAVILGFIGSTGFWNLIEKKTSRTTVHTKLLIGLAHDRITFLGKQYLERGSITQDEYENLHEFLYKPYVDMGGNGFAKILMEKIDKLPNREITIQLKKDKENDADK